ncbi:DUF4352 domain-containing protein [Virgibacillus halophilus]|uniref:DUF4352 domain-containing protein n=1 Tax=Tigheibacillus halophilus TaxID=361280 RepID=UPI003640BE54
MKKILAVLILGILLVGCSDGENKNEKSNIDDSATSKGEDVNKSDEGKKDEKKVYQIGETAVITSDMYDFDYQVTVNDFKLVREVDGVKIEDYISGAIDEDRFAVINVTIKNISDEAYVPNEMFSANFSKQGDDGGHTSEDQFFTERDKELQPGKEITGNIVFTTRVNSAKTFLIKFEGNSDEETHFELPNPEK